jgi:hypothetical protein
MTSLDFPKLVVSVQQLLTSALGYPASSISCSFDAQGQIRTMTIDLSRTPSSGPKAAVGEQNPPSPVSSSGTNTFLNDIFALLGRKLSGTSASD